MRWEEEMAVVGRSRMGVFECVLTFLLGGHSGFGRWDGM